MNEKLSTFHNLLNASSLVDADKESIRFMASYFDKEQNPKLSSRIYCFMGAPGVGKSHLAEQLLNAMNKETVYGAGFALNIERGLKCPNFKKIIEQMNNFNEQIIFLDDINYIFNYDGCFNIDSEDKRDFMQIMDMVKRNPKKILLLTTDDIAGLDLAMIDRIEVPIFFDTPTNQEKKTFLEANYIELMSSECIVYLSANSIGYSYRNLAEVVKLAYRLGNSTLNLESIKRAIKLSKATLLTGMDISTDIQTKLKDIIGKEKALTTIKRLIKQYRNEIDTEELGLKKNNLLILHGSKGSGKSFMVKAIAGELEYPVINVKAKHFFNKSNDPLERISKIARMLRKYDHCIIFIDETDKILGSRNYEDDGMIIGELNQALEGITEEKNQGILILAMNDINKFGESLKDRFTTIEFTPPNYHERLEYLKRKHTKHKIDYHTLARNTENQSYREIDRTWNEIIHQAIEQKKQPNAALITKILNEQRRTEEKQTIYG